MEILFGNVATDVHFIVSFIEHLDIDETLASHYRFHEPEVEAPDHDDTENNRQGHHHNPVLYVIHVEGRFLIRIRHLISVVARQRLFGIYLICSHLSLVILLQEGIEKKSGLRKYDQQNEKTDVSANDGKQL